LATLVVVSGARIASSFSTRAVATPCKPASSDSGSSRRAGKRVRLGDKIGAGGEGAVFATDSGVVCKVYAGQQLGAGTRDKVE